MPTACPTNGMSCQRIKRHFYTRFGRNPFGFSAKRISDLYCGMKMDVGLNAQWKKVYRKTIHDHNPMNDARGNAGTLLAFKDMGLKVPA